ncbi:Ig-like domain-containing protein [Geofilum sp. OHC36d9]|uniref:Ig-like domain-containing protein n=1 Tax=Geofilum sp. OHC36d9 TaxID=3458413 RepID=UPI00403384D3
MKKILQEVGLIVLLISMVGGSKAQTYTFSPADGSTDVSTSPTLTITFDGPVSLVKGKSIYVTNSDWSAYFAFSTGSDGVGLPPVSVPADDELIVSGNTLTIDLSGEVLESEQEYSVFTDAGAIKVSDDVWDGLATYPTSIWSFTTESSVVVSVTDFSPADDATDVSISPTLSVTFDQDIILGSTGFFRIYDELNQQVVTIDVTSPKVSVNANVLEVSLSNVLLSYSSLYHVNIDAGFVESFGGISDNTSWTFTTETTPPSWLVDPTVSQSTTGYTVSGQTDSGGIYYFIVTDELKTPTAAQIKAGTDAYGNSAIVAINDQMYASTTFSNNQTFSSALPLGQVYYVYIVAASIDSKNSDVKLSYIDRTLPSVNEGLCDPQDGETSAAVNTDITITFTEKMYGYSGGTLVALDETFFDLTTGDTPVDFTFSVSTDGKVVVLTPVDELLGSTEYQIAISTLSDAYYNQLASLTRTFETDDLNIWTGANASDPTNWFLDANWASSYVSGKSVKIPADLSNYPVIADGDDVSVNNLTIEAGANLSQTGGQLTIVGDFVLESTVDINASYIYQGGTLNVSDDNVHVEQQISNIDWTYLLASPTMGATKSGILSTYPLRYYDNPTDSWIDIGNTATMEPGRGYSIWTDYTDFEFTGALNLSDVSVDLVRTDGQGYGWNLLGNPFTAAIDWSLLDVDTSKIVNGYWIWDPRLSLYGALNSESGVMVNMDYDKIPSNHAFLVKVKPGISSASLNITNQALVANVGSMLKSSTPFDYIKMAGINGDYKDEIALAFSDKASILEDKYDTEKKFANRSYLLELYTEVGDLKACINSFPLDGERIIPLGYYAKKTGSYSIELVDNPSAVEVSLIDHQTDKEFDFSEGNSYSFTAGETGYNSERFALRLKRVATDITSLKHQSLVSYVNNGTLFVEVPDDMAGDYMTVVDVNGKVITKVMLKDGTNQIDGLVAGLYFLNFTTNSESIKVLVK